MFAITCDRCEGTIASDRQEAPEVPHDTLRLISPAGVKWLFCVDCAADFRRFADGQGDQRCPCGRTREQNVHDPDATPTPDDGDAQSAKRKAPFGCGRRVMDGGAQADRDFDLLAEAELTVKQKYALLRMHTRYRSRCVERDDLRAKLERVDAAVRRFYAENGAADGWALASWIEDALQ